MITTAISLTLVLIVILILAMIIFLRKRALKKKIKTVRFRVAWNVLGLRTIKLKAYIYNRRSTKVYENDRYATKLNDVSYDLGLL